MGGRGGVLSRSGGGMREMGEFGGREALDADVAAFVGPDWRLREEREVD